MQGSPPLQGSLGSAPPATGRDMFEYGGLDAGLVKRVAHEAGLLEMMHNPAAQAVSFAPQDRR